MAVALAGCGRKPAEPAPPVRPVLSFVVQSLASQARTRFTGTVEPRYQSQLSFQTGGRIISRQVEVGDLVRQGQLLATLDPTLARLSVTTAQAELRNVVATLTSAAAENARQHTMVRTGAVSQSQVDAALAARDTAQARVNQAEAGLRKAAEQFRYTTLISQYDGVVASWAVEVGQVVAAGQGVVTVVQTGSRDAVFDLSGDALQGMTSGAAFTTSLLADPAVTATATVREIAPQIDAGTSSQRVRLTLDNPPDAFRLGASISLMLETTSAPKIRIPRTAILQAGGQTRVWLVGADSRARARVVQLGANAADMGAADMVEVAAGLTPGERVIIAGVHSLSEDQAVKISPQQDPAS